MPAPDRAAGRCVRRGRVLRDAVDGAAAPGRGPRVRRRGLPAWRAPSASAPSWSGWSAPPAKPRLTAARPGCGAPCLGRCERGPVALFTVAGNQPETVATAPADAAEVVEHLERALAGTSLLPARGSAGPGETRLAHVRRSVPQAGGSGAPAPAPGGCRRPRQPRRLPGHRRLPGPPARAGAGAGGGDRGGHRLRAAGPRRRRLPHGTQVGRRRRAARPSPLHGVQRGRVGARHVQGPRAHGGRPVRDRRGDDDRGLRHRQPTTGTSTCAASTRCPPAGMANAIEQARAAGSWARTSSGSGVDFDIEIRRGAGAYICGEETALFNSIEGRRGEPRNKPPFPVEVGLFGKPTAGQQRRDAGQRPGHRARRRRGVRGRSARGLHGTKLFCLSGAVERPGVYEVPFGATLGELIGDGRRRGRGTDAAGRAAGRRSGRVRGPG